MNISITFRQMDPSQAIREHAEGKIARLQKLLTKPMTAKVTLSVQKQLHVVEVQISSGRERVEARESGDDLYAAIDKVMDKLERQISASKEESVSKARRNAATVRTSGFETPEVDSGTVAKKDAPG